MRFFSFLGKKNKTKTKRTLKIFLFNCLKNKALRFTIYLVAIIVYNSIYVNIFIYVSKR
jgi:hypothetical protein